MEELWSLWRKQNKNIPKVILAFGKEQFPPWSWKLKRLETSSIGSQTSETKVEIKVHEEPGKCQELWKSTP